MPHIGPVYSKNFLVGVSLALVLDRLRAKGAGTASMVLRVVKRGFHAPARPSRVPNEYRALMVNLKRPVDGFTWGGREGERVD